MKRIAYLTVLLACLGCGTQPEADKTSAEASQVEAAHDHAHEEMGTHGGHMLHLEPSGAHAEWTHDDENFKITVYFDGDVDGAKFVAKVGESTEEFPLAADGEGWSITSEALLTHLNMGEAVPVQLVIASPDGELSTKIEKHEHHHH